MKERIQKINEVAQENFEKAQGMLEMLNEICGTKFGWLAKRVVIFENPNGSTAEKDAKYGWTKTSLNDEAKAFVDGMQDKKFELHRKSLPKNPGAAKTKQSSRKYVCPMCGCIIRATKEVHVICGDCNVEFEEEL